MDGLGENLLFGRIVGPVTWECVVHRLWEKISVHDDGAISVPGEYVLRR